jgi:outer membrane protein assembly factor BamB
LPLRLAWTCELAPAPAPAWPAPARGSLWQRLDRLTPRVIDDRAYQPVVAAGRVLFASSADDHVYCLDAVAGELLWSFGCDAPVRYAPSVADGKVLLGSDDGCIYALDLQQGSVVWSFRPGPEDQRIPGNGRLISRWPIRTSVLPLQNRVVACAGLFPSQGTLAVALNLATGAVEWQQPLPGLSPQGTLLAAETLVYVPTGRGNLFSLDAETGEVFPTLSGPGGSFAVLSDQHLVSGPGDRHQLALQETTSRTRLAEFQGQQLVVTAKLSLLLRETHLVALDRRVLAKNPEASTESVAWRREIDGALSLIASGSHVWVGGEGWVSALALEGGEPLWRQPLPGRALAMAAVQDRLVVTLDSGAVFCFESGLRADGEVRNPAHEALPDESVSQAGEAVAAALRQGKNHWKGSRGYALVLEASDLAIEFLLEHSELFVVVLDQDLDRVHGLRRRWRQRGLYGTRVSAHVGPVSTLPFTDYFANLVAASSSSDTTKQEILRVLHPGRGLAFVGDEILRRPALEGVGSWTHMYGNLANSASSADSRVHSDLRLQWFGEPGPRRMIDRHLRGPPPLAHEGRLFVIGEDLLIAVDAYTGTELWQRELPGSTRYSMPYDCGYVSVTQRGVFAAVDDEIWRIDSTQGTVQERIGVPKEGPQPWHWGYLGVQDSKLYGSFMKPDAARTSASRSGIDEDYRSEQPLVTSRGLLCWDLDQETLDWSYSDGLILHPTITVHDGTVYFLESRNAACLRHETDRVPLAELSTSDLFLVAVDSRSGRRIWQRRLKLRGARNVVYLQGVDGDLILTSCQDSDSRDAEYHIDVYAANHGTLRWSRRHDNGKPGQLGHGEQVHHPVLLNDWIVAEPVIYERSSGRRVTPFGDSREWTLQRPGHSCGTLSGAGECLFFRANNPTVLDLRSGSAPERRFQTLAPTRAGCWINILPAQGLVLIPEASASCVCNYSLQTSMAFRPR